MGNSSDKKSLISEETVVSTSTLAYVCRISDRRIQQLTEDGILERIGRGRYLLIDSVHRYLSFLDRSEGVDTETADFIRQKKKAEADLMTSKALIKEMEARELEKTMISAEAVRTVTNDLVDFMGKKISNLPEVVAVPASKATSPSEASQIIRKAVYGIMNEIAAYQYNPNRYEGIEEFDE